MRVAQRGSAKGARACTVAEGHVERSEDARHIDTLAGIPWGRFALAAGIVLCGLSGIARAQVSPAETLLIQHAIGPRVEALTILGGDFGLSDGEFHTTEVPGSRATVAVDTNVDKFGGDGEVGSPRPLGTLHIAWQPLVQGNIGYLQSRTQLPEAQFGGAVNEFRTLAVEFGGGVRLWTTDRLSFAPTVMVLYGHTDDDYSVSSLPGPSSVTQLRELGLIDWSIETWSLRPALNVQYVLPVSSMIFTFSSDAVGFFTHGFGRSNIHLLVGGNAGFVTNKLDLDIPLGVELFGRELHTGGYLSRTDLLGDLRQGLDVQHLNELHGRLVLKFPKPYWGMQWIGLGASYLWGTHIEGWTVGADVQFFF